MARDVKLAGALSVTSNPENVESSELLELLRTASRGDKQAMASAFDHFRGRLRRFVQVRLDRRLRGRCDASDVVQEAFVEALRRLPAYLAKPTVPFFLWLRTVAAQKVVDIHRHEFARKRDARRDVHYYRGDGSPTTSVALADAFVTTRSSPSDRVVVDEVRTALARALEELEGDDREILMLRYFERLSNVEAAHVLGLGENAASQRHVRALKRFARVIRTYPDLKSSLSLP